ncbi:MAG: hypothetical protein ACUVQP_04115 [Bacteroidales bacterium]
MFDELKMIQVPIQTIQGTNDEFGSIKQLEYIALKCPEKTEHYLIENGRHHPYLEFLSV